MFTHYGISDYNLQVHSSLSKKALVTTYIDFCLSQALGSFSQVNYVRRPRHSLIIAYSRQSDVLARGKGKGEAGKQQAR